MATTTLQTDAPVPAPAEEQGPLSAADLAAEHTGVDAAQAPRMTRDDLVDRRRTRQHAIAGGGRG